MSKRTAVLKSFFAILLVITLGILLLGSKKEKSEEVEVNVAFVIPQWMMGQASVVLQDTIEDRYLPIFIGNAEAQAIERVLKGITPTRPLTHDLLINIMRKLKIEIEKVSVVDIRDGIYYAEILLKRGRKKTVIDARPSDAIALALRADAPVFVRSELFEKSKLYPHPSKKEIGDI